MITRARKIAVGLTVALAASGMLASGLAVPAYAEPTTLEGARIELERLQEEQSRIEEDWAEARLRLEEGQARLAALNADIAGQQNKVDVLTGQARQVALHQFQNRGLDTTASLLVSSNPDSFLKELSTTSKVTENMNAVLQNFQAQVADLTDLRRSADAEVLALQEEERRMAELDAQSQQRVDQMDRTFDRLSSEEQARLQAEQDAGVLDDAEVAALLALTEADIADSMAPRRQLAADFLTDEPAPAVEAQPGTAVALSTAGRADPRALKAVQYALSKVGKSRYVWGAEGPWRFDCSGLMLAAYKSAGVSLPHSSRTQSRLGRPVSRATLRPGDLIFYYSPVSHVGMYVGNGKFVHARNTRVNIVLQTVSSYPARITGYRRIVG